MIDEPVLKKKKVNKSRYVFFSILGLLLLGCISYGFVFFIEQYQGSNLTLRSSPLTIEITQDGNINMEDMQGQKDSDGINNDKTTITVTNTSTTTVGVRISILEETSSIIDAGNIRFGVFEGSNTLQIGNLGESNNILYEFDLEAGASKSLTSTLWLDYYYSSAGNESFKGKYKISVVNVSDYGRVYLTSLVSKNVGLVKVSDTEYRYSGTPSNYINFNNETWRIIGVINGQIQIVKEDSVTNQTATQYYDNVLDFYKNYVNESITPSFLTATDTYSADWISSVTNKVTLTLKSNIYIVGGDGTSSNPYLLNTEEYLPSYYKIYNANKDYVLSSDGDTMFIAGSSDNVTNNYLSYGNVLWRVVGLNNDGTIKIVTNDIIDSKSFGSASSYVLSDINRWLNDTFYHTLNNSSLIVANSGFDGSSVTTSDTKPTKQYLIKENVGLLNVYEWTKSYTNATSATGYLKTSSAWLTISKNASDTIMWVVSASGTAASEAVSNNTYGLRPAIILKSNVSLEGSGTQSSPWVIKTN